MKTTGCSESINASVKRLLGSQTPLSELIDQITIVIEMIDVVGQRRLMQQLSTNVDVRTMCSFEHHAAPILTPCAFSKIQEEIISSFQYLTSKKDHGTYEVTHFSKKEKGQNVSLMVEDNVMNCSCKGFEFTGIICRHSLHVLFKEHFIQIPDRYLPKRWRHSTSLISNVSSSTSATYDEHVQ
ncbi:protein FAR1-RELATED SEQUENCE 11-like [Amborella trichopoda]|uniref:Protein FAR1-RELATED SEQUENCE n=1 Tax=Amborella trichopoda TaxID=13333 RepID=W1NKD6_AMBTC|nr:protein FAR1-RELATED SEQUENCE 11-like [Amborella trichopoda]XP_020531071.1 protein FAR1-RELATED SEQUENCE 11-like [Amborella trichopoda]XP_020531078.1 protein FAR1-RELATED SEQUENCE 11-like [Amborella trichopoda]XP_020531083.1 protein FAR1-RELATED SEQUENCE 11-like [Amborella trichopoda]ERM95936.1 hypothetical protein AMTR_s00060p00191200 [Amborella trichopoda]|eukprot:XP_020531062.1 protein FAR1-RELATED SEQUENCE 11-like [Amborella trichopoda]